MPMWGGLMFQDGGSPLMLQFSYLHDHVMMIMAVVMIFIAYIMLYTLYSGHFYKHLSEGTTIESVWSVIPALLLVVLAVPSMKILYVGEDFKSPSMSFKVVAHQWYWSYVSPLFGGFSFYSEPTGLVGSYEQDSFITPSDEMGLPRLLGGSESLFIPVSSVSRLLISSTDVIHSFAVPGLGLKVDALPGRINQLYVNPSRVGSFLGQCSEICGSNHSFMPINVFVGSSIDYDLFTISCTLELLESEGFIST